MRDGAGERSVRPQDETGGTVTFLSDWKLSHLPSDNRPLPSVAHFHPPPPVKDGMAGTMPR
ncbi:predicted protein [Streptomyces viridochromogenes DSM 40736]|uniref:Predicted protein n=1 Tax=Streptomyces viridochromogenes (strain DSM 40736 / JCM 4977 / BCRC 1201 / Tue 494) TaxID=591159 RepID=D9XHX1_STRVT|nr:predicted protein [Streptomyces viridochromogenes DSM 40736]